MWAMSRAIAQVTLQRDSGLPADVVTNTYHFEDDDGLPGIDPGGIDTNGPGLVNRLVVFYQAIAANLAGTLTGQGTVRLYNFGEPTPRVPRITTAFTFSPGSTALPGEVALCISYRASLEAGAVAARRRGRVFIGPLTTGVAAGATTGAADPRPADITLTTMLSAFRTMSQPVSGGAFRLAVYSPTAHGLNPGDVGAAWNDATFAWMDNAFDTIRSRGAVASKRFQGSLENSDSFALAA